MPHYPAKRKLLADKRGVIIIIIIIIIIITIIISIKMLANRVKIIIITIIMKMWLFSVTSSFLFI